MLRKISNFRKGSDDIRSLRRSDSTIPETIDGSEDLRTTNTPIRSSTSSSGQVSKSVEPESGPLGLSVLYTPNNGHKADIIFVHGLGGTSRWTWSRNRDPELFWPLTFLPLEPDICLARIMTFGYNSAFHKSADGKTSVLDFAENLLHDLKFSVDKDHNELKIGSVPLIFVAHSMGGLVVKEVCIQGSRRPSHENIINSVEAIMFLATPHRGAQVAQLLNRLMQSLSISNSKQYVADLMPKSFTLDSQAESFRHICNKFKLFSFYETQPTAMGLKNTKIMLLGKETSVLGYPDEISRALDADHHNVAKYTGQTDPNYIIVRNALKAIMKNVLQVPNNQALPPSRSNLDALYQLLKIQEPASVDLLFYRGQWKNGTCNWVLGDTRFQEWTETTQPNSNILWINGGPATGKSVLSSYIVKHLEDENLSHQYFFIRHGQPRKRTLSLLLRSIAYQIAKNSPDFLKKAVALEAELDFDTMDFKSIWDRLFRSILFRVEQTEPSYWIIDGLDEMDHPRALIEFLSELPKSIRILITSRNNPEFVSAFQSLAPTTIFFNGSVDDIHHYIRREVVFTGSDGEREKIISLLQERAENNFLYITLAVSEVNLFQNRSFEDVKQAILRFPIGMEALYDRMATSIAQSQEDDRQMATKTLQAVNCAYKALTIPQMAQILGDLRRDEDHLKSSILAVCCGFVLIDEGSVLEGATSLPRIAMIHLTSREYLLSDDDRPFKINVQAAHALMFRSSMECLMSSDIKSNLRQNQAAEFVDYAACYWSRHLSNVSTDSQALGTLRKFLTEKDWVLIWIHYLAASNQLRVLTQTAKHFSECVAELRKHGATEDETGQLAFEIQGILESWAIELIKIAGKWGTVLLTNPRLIYKSIPPFCPRSSPIYQQFGQAQAKNLAVSGPTAMMEKWDDSLAKMTFGSRVQSTFIAAAANRIAVLAPVGKVFVYDSSTFEQPAYGAIEHHERISKMVLNTTATLAATCGYETTKVWEVHTGRCIVQVQNPADKPRPYTMIFTNDDDTLVVGFEDSEIRSLDLRKTFPSWETITKIEEQEIPGHFVNVPSNMVLSKDGSRIIMAYRGHPLSAWKLRPGKKPKHSGYLWRRGKSEKTRGEVEDVVWHPQYKLVLGVYIDGTVFKWRPGFKDSRSKSPRWEPKEITTGASKIKLSGDGHLFATGDPRGAIKLYTTLGFHLLYHLASEDMVGDIAFSPDMRRLYDTRGFYASAWEPTALIKWSEQMHSNMSDLDSIGEISSTVDSTVSVNWSQTIDSITVIAAPSSRHYIYCVGTVGGAVCLYHTQRGKLADIRLANGLFGIDEMAFSRDGKYLCFADLSQTLFIVSIDHDDKSAATKVKIEAEIALSQVIKGSIVDIMFHQDSTCILVEGSSSIHTISLGRLIVEHSLDLDMDGARWISHPGDKSRLIGVSANRIQVLDWTLKIHRTYNLISPHTVEDDYFGITSITGKMDRLLPATNGKYILAQITSPTGRNPHNKTFFILETSLIPSSKTDPTKINEGPDIAFILVPPEISSQISLALGFVKGTGLIYLSRDSAVCHWDINLSQLGHNPKSPDPIIAQRSDSIVSIASNSAISPGSEPTPTDRRRSSTTPANVSIRELFHLPGDWISQDSLKVSILWTKERSFLCPRNGEVALVRSPELRAS